MPWSRPNLSKTHSKKMVTYLNKLSGSNKVSIDIGGTLSKLILVEEDLKRKKSFKNFVKTNFAYSLQPELSLYFPSQALNIHFLYFETFNVYNCGKFISRIWEEIHGGEKSSTLSEERRLRATGGGSLKNSSLYNKNLGLTLICKDEMLCTVAGMNFLIAFVDHEFFAYSSSRKGSVPISFNFIKSQRVFFFSLHQTMERIDSIFPYLLVNIGSGVSIIKVTGMRSFQRVSGSSIGGGTFWGLCSLLTGCRTFSEVIELSKTGCSSNVDMLVGDIYGGNYTAMGLGSEIIAASFGKLAMYHNKENHQTNFLVETGRSIKFLFKIFLQLVCSMPLFGALIKSNLSFQNIFRGKFHEDPFQNHYRANDLAISALRAISYNIGQIAFLNARRFGLEKIFFGGNFVRKHSYAIASISYAVKFWSKNKARALFSLHDGFLGALGAFFDGNVEF